MRAMLPTVYKDAKQRKRRYRWEIYHDRAGKSAEREDLKMSQ